MSHDFELAHLIVEYKNRNFLGSLNIYSFI